MTRLTKGIALTVGSLLVIPVALFVYIWAHYRPSDIVDFRPAQFEAKAASPFFYSIGDELKNSDEIDPNAPTLLHGRIGDFLVSPDQTEIAVAARGHLYVVWKNGNVREIVPVNSIYRGPKPIGEHFFRDEDFQWSRDGDTLYLIRDRYYNLKGSQLFSKYGELWKYDIQTGSLRLVLRPFPAFTYFFGRRGGIYFSAPTAAGDLRLKYFDGVRIRNVGTPDERAIPLAELQTKFRESPFFSFSPLDLSYDQSDRLLKENGVVVADQKNGSEVLEIAGKPYLTVSEGQGFFKGSFYCPETFDSVFLPGRRYFLFDVPDCGNYSGQLLIDTRTGEYERLPRHTRVYITPNTTTDPHYRISAGGIAVE